MTPSYSHRISSSNPAAITVYPDTYAVQPGAGRDVKFGSMEAVSKFFGRDPIERPEKSEVHFFTRGRCEGHRFKRNLQPPFLVMMDVDGSEVALEECHARLASRGVDHVGWTTWSHGKEGAEGRHYYRVLTDLLARSWEELEDVTVQLFELVEMGPDLTRESFKSPGFYVPAVHPDRKELYEHLEFLDGGST